MNAFAAVLRREFGVFFATPLAYVFVLIFLATGGVFTFYIGNFFERGQADLQSFFIYHPWLYLVLVPALSMRLWAEERDTGSIELLLTLPLHLWQAMLAKFLAAWLFCGLALLMSFPLWLSVNYLGDPDNGVILAAYLGSWLMSAGFLAIGCCFSALNRNQVTAFIISVVVSFLFVMSGQDFVVGLFSGWAPTILVDAISSIGFLPHYDAASRGVLSLRDLIYYLAFIATWLMAATMAVRLKQS